ncbi:MAG: hypothetical protein R2725_08050 [Solirubrobacterales bacterium]
MLPLAHLGHWLWIFYVLPVLFVIGGIAYSTIAGRRQQRQRPSCAGDPQPEEEAAPPAGGAEGGPRTDALARPQDPPP